MIEFPAANPGKYMLAIGSRAPEFTLPDQDDRTEQSEEGPCQPEGDPGPGSSNRLGRHVRHEALAIRRKQLGLPQGMETDSRTGVFTVQSDDAHPGTGAILPAMAGRHDPGDADVMPTRPWLETQVPGTLDGTARQDDDQTIGEDDCGRSQSWPVKRPDRSVRR